MREDKKQQIKLLIGEIDELSIKIEKLKIEQKAIILRLKNLYKGGADMKVVN